MPSSLLLLLCGVVAAHALRLQAPAQHTAARCGTFHSRASSALMAVKKVKTVQVVLSSPVEGLGKAGELVSVKQAYAQNFLVAKGLGAVATPDVLKRIAEQRAVDEAEAAAQKVAAEQGAKTLETVFGSQGLFIKKKVGRDGAIFGSVTSAQVAEIVAERTGVKVDKKAVTVPSISAVGSVIAEVALHRDVVSKLKICVVPATM